MSSTWYVLRSKPNKEDFFHNQLLAHRLEVFHPRIPVRTINPRARKMHPYFPGYIFVRVDLEQISPSFLHWMPGSAGLVSFDSIPASVPDGLINAIRNRVEEINLAGGEHLQGLRSGAMVVVEAGPFKGHQAIFDASLSGKERVRVFLKLLHGRQVPVELSSGLIRPKK